MRQLIAYTDGARRGNGDASAGVYFPVGLWTKPEFEGRGDIGRMGSTGRYLGKQTNNFAEYSGVITALELAIKYGYTSLKVFSDSQLIVKQMQGVYRVESESLRPLYEKAYTLACQLDFEINWVPREQNKEADAVCNEILDRHQGKTN